MKSFAVLMNTWRLAQVKKPPTAKEFLKNIEEKEKDPDFLGDLEGLLRPGITFDHHEAFTWLKEEVIAKMK